jgi:hypothetical protein
MSAILFLHSASKRGATEARDSKLNYGQALKQTFTFRKRNHCLFVKNPRLLFVSAPTCKKGERRQVWVFEKKRRVFLIAFQPILLPYRERLPGVRRQFLKEPERGPPVFDGLVPSSAAFPR